MSKVNDLTSIKKSKYLRIRRISQDGGCGELRMPSWKGSVIWSRGAGWEHISAAPYNHRITPGWDDMCLIKDIFFNAEEWAVQFHPAKSEYVNDLPNCLHLWRPVNGRLPTPPAELTGRSRGTAERGGDPEKNAGLYREYAPPQKPLVQEGHLAGHDDDGKPVWVPAYSCPACGMEVEGEYVCCPYCRQELDWRGLS